MKKSSVKCLALLSSLLVLNSSYAVDLGGSVAAGLSNEGTVLSAEASYDGINLSDTVSVGGAIDIEKKKDDVKIELYPASVTIDYNEYALNAGPAFEITDKSKESGAYVAGAVMLNDYDISVDATVGRGVLDRGTIDLGYDVLKIGAAIDTTLGEDIYAGVSAEKKYMTFDDGKSSEELELEAALNYALSPSTEI